MADQQTAKPFHIWTIRQLQRDFECNADYHAAMQRLDAEAFTIANQQTYETWMHGASCLRTAQDRQSFYVVWFDPTTYTVGIERSNGEGQASAERLTISPSCLRSIAASMTKAADRYDAFVKTTQAEMGYQDVYSDGGDQ